MTQITTGEAAKILGISKRTLYRWEKEGRIRSVREGILNVRIFDRNYIVMVKQIQDLDKRLNEIMTKLPQILEQSKRHQLEQVFNPGEKLKLLSSSEVEASKKAYEKEVAWVAEHRRLVAELCSYPRDILKEVLDIK